ncbi:MAG: polyprenyl diphosphate synthase [Christensenellaceae bacterium]
MSDMLPGHIAFIMDGNGRWAKERGKPRVFGHKAGYAAFDKIATYGFEKGVTTMSFYAFSTENWARPEDEVKNLMALLRRALKLAGPKLLKNKIRLKISGDLSRVNAKTKALLDDLLEKTANFAPNTLNICFSYGSRAEICRAFNDMMKDGVTECDEETVSQYLYTSDIPDPDMIVRTSGEQRLSNFLLWQSAYSELYFTDVYWPDFNEAEFDKAVEWFKTRKRRFGKTE